MELLQRNISDHLSYYIKPEGNITAVMPDQDATFTLKFIQDFVGPEVEVACFTRDGYALVHNVNAEAQELPVNEVATSIVRQATGEGEVLRGRAFLIHPDHFDRRVVPAA
jgi:hypothetical protein